MTSLATMFAYAELEPVMESLGCYNRDVAREQLACVVAFHSCRPGSFASAYAWEDIKRAFGLGWTAKLPSAWYVETTPPQVFIEYDDAKIACPEGMHPLPMWTMREDDKPTDGATDA